MSEDVPVFFRNRQEWRKWLSKNHNGERQIWILAYKRHTGKGGLLYGDALDEALCFGWIDSRLRRIDDERHMWRFAPRKPDSIWSLSNRRRAERLIMEGKMAAPGRAKIEAAKRSGEWDQAYAPSKPPRMPRDLKNALVKDGQAWRNFQAFAKSYRTTYIYWVTAAKRDETRKKRIREVVRRARENIKFYMG